MTEYLIYRDDPTSLRGRSGLTPMEVVLVDKLNDWERNLLFSAHPRGRPNNSSLRELGRSKWGFSARGMAVGNGT